MESILYTLPGNGDGCAPLDSGGLALAGNKIYGTTYWDSQNGGGFGTVFQLARSGNDWTPSVIYKFSYYSDGSAPSAGVTVDPAGNLYGTTDIGGCDNDCQGTVYELTQSQSGWTEHTVYGFVYDQSPGNEPGGGVVLDGAGNLYGSTVSGGMELGGTIFQLAPANGGWNFNLLYSFPGGLTLGPFSDLLLDNSGNLYGTTYSDGLYGHGSVFELTRSGDSWTYATLYDFQGAGDGGNPKSNLVMDAQGNLYGTTYAGGNYGTCGGHGCGVVFEITP